ncbi:hypothetical protein CEXT_160161 [Caerostris extrusa]|uniref:Uncharacterized protein n=1 Tax=Caerostris extrusa TaxID=172846 RepID=A0AAV4NCM4_CAEEX|nr:hypothetical protein CEXT_160161 [Caerostris extrusa]
MEGGALQKLVEICIQLCSSLPVKWCYKNTEHDLLQDIFKANVKDFVIRFDAVTKNTGKLGLEFPSTERTRNYYTRHHLAAFKPSSSNPPVVHQATVAHKIEI